jgi:hypothetical protein
MAFFAQTTAGFWNKLIITLVFEKNANFFAENWQNHRKIAIITSTPEVTRPQVFFRPNNATDIADTKAPHLCCRKHSRCHFKMRLRRHQHCFFLQRQLKESFAYIFMFLLLAWDLQKVTLVAASRCMYVGRLCHPITQSYLWCVVCTTTPKPHNVPSI